MHQTQWSPERPLPPPVSLTSQSHHEKPPEVTCTGRGNPAFPASTRERPRETFFNTSRGQIPLPWLGSSDALPLATRVETRLPWRPTRGSLTSPSIFSGPAGGLIGTARLSEIVGRADIIAVDIGGTSTDACVVRGGIPALKYQAELEKLPLMIPAYNISTIGAGGGSIARVEGGLLKVGPQSAGAEPGPICYGRGGQHPTFTDAAVELGYIDPGNFLGGEVKLDAAAARAGIVTHVAEPLGLTETEAARGIFDVLLARTVSAIREITVQEGYDPREFSMLAYGGAGPMFVPLVAREMGVQEIIVPQAPAGFSAWGMLMTDFVQE